MFTIMELRPFDLNLRHLRAVDAIVEHGSVSAAALRIGLSQPALTQGLGKLERQLGAALFDRRADGLTPTPAGSALAERTTAAFAHLAQAVRGGRLGNRGFTRPDQLMTATQLDAYLRVADTGSFAAAAAASGASQPALHRAVRELQQIIGVPLVERRGRTIGFTAAGRRVARGVRLAERELAAGVAELSGDPAATGRITIGAMPLSRARLLPPALAAFSREVPGVAIEVVEGSWRELIDPLADGVLDFTIGALREIAPPGLEQRPLFRDQLAVIARAGHPLAAVPEPTLDQLASYGWIVGSAGTPLLAQWQALFANRPRPPTPIECGSVMVIRGVLHDSDLLTLLSPDQVALEIAAGMLTTIGPPLAHSVRTIGLTKRTGWRPPEAQRRLLELIDEAAANLQVPEIE